MICIVLTTYNPNLNFFIKQVESLRAQTLTDWKCLVSDDASEPEIFSQIQSLFEQDKRFVVQRHNTRVGVYKNFESGFATVRDWGAQIIFPCDQDDIWQPNKLFEMSTFLRQSQSPLCYSDASIIDDTDKKIFESLFTFEGRYRGQMTPTLLSLKNVITGCCMAFDGKLLDQALPFPEQTSGALDFHHDLWLGLCACVVGAPVYMAQPLVQYRLHSNNVIGPQQKRIVWELRRLKVLSVFGSVVRYFLRTNRIYNEYRKNKKKFGKRTSDRVHDIQPLSLVSLYAKYVAAYLLGGALSPVSGLLKKENPS